MDLSYHELHRGEEIQKWENKEDECRGLGKRGGKKVGGLLGLGFIAFLLYKGHVH